jgi:hypothetical protein
MPIPNHRGRRRFVDKVGESAMPKVETTDVSRRPAWWWVFFMPGKVILWIEYMFPRRIGGVFGSARRRNVPLIQIVFLFCDFRPCSVLVRGGARSLTFERDSRLCVMRNPLGRSFQRTSLNSSKQTQARSSANFQVDMSHFMPQPRPSKCELGSTRSNSSEARSRRSEHGHGIGPF